MHAKRSPWERMLAVSGGPEWLGLWCMLCLCLKLEDTNIVHEELSSLGRHLCTCSSSPPAHLLRQQLHISRDVGQRAADVPAPLPLQLRPVPLAPLRALRVTAFLWGPGSGCFLWRSLCGGLCCCWWRRCCLGLRSWLLCCCYQVRGWRCFLHCFHWRWLRIHPARSCQAQNAKAWGTMGESH